MIGNRKILATISGAVALVVASIIGSLLAPVFVHAQLGGVQTWAGNAGGTANALTLTVHNVVGLNDLLGVPIRFLPSSTNAAGNTTLTINIDTGGTLGPTAINRPTANIGLQQTAGGDLQTGQMAEVVYDGTVFELKSQISMTHIGASVEVRGGVAPLGTLMEDGSCYSQTTYAALYAVIGTTYNAQAPSSCSGSQFAVPDSRGSLFAALDNQGANGAANRITSGGSGCTATAVGLCGSQNQTLTQAQLPAVSPTFSGTSGTVTVSGAGIGIGNYGSNVGSGAGIYVIQGNGSSGSASGSFTPAGTISALGSGNAHPILNPISLGRRAIKY